MVHRLRSFGRKSSVRHQAIDGVEKGARGRQEFKADQVALGIAVGRAHVPDSGVGECGLAVECQAYRLNGFDCQRLMCFDQRALMRQVEDTNSVSGIEGAPKRTKHLEADVSPAISRRAHHHPFALSVQGGYHRELTRFS